MKRDMDMIRDLLLKIEDGREIFNLVEYWINVGEYRLHDDEVELTREEVVKRQEHLLLLGQAGFVSDVRRVGTALIYVGHLTWEGHEFLDTLRDPTRWEKAKGVATKAGGVGVKALIEIGKSLAKQELQKLGIPIP